MVDQEMFSNAFFHLIPIIHSGFKARVLNKFKKKKLKKGGCDQIGKEVLTQDGSVTLCLTEKKSSAPSLPMYLPVYNSLF